MSADAGSRDAEAMGSVLGLCSVASWVRRPGVGGGCGRVRAGSAVLSPGLCGSASGLEPREEGEAREPGSRPSRCWLLPFGSSLQCQPRPSLVQLPPPVGTSSLSVPWCPGRPRTAALSFPEASFVLTRSLRGHRGPVIWNRFDSGVEGSRLVFEIKIIPLSTFFIFSGVSPHTSKCLLLEKLFGFVVLNFFFLDVRHGRAI